MSHAPRALAAALGWPWLWLYGGGLALVTLACDLLATPWVLARRRRATWPDAPPRSRNASLIVLSFDGEDYLRALLPTLEVAAGRAPGLHEIIVVDNGSRDGTADYVQRHHPRVRLVRLPENQFFIRGNRAGVAVAQGDILVFVNNDMRVEPDFLTTLLARFDRDDVFAVTGRIDMAEPRTETGRTRGVWRRGMLALHQGHGPPAPLIPALWAGGGSSAFDRAKHDALGGFEDLYEPCYAEDLSLSYQAWKRGWRVLFAPDSGVYHVHRGTSVRVFGRTRVERLARRNRELWFWRSITDPRMVLAHAFWLPWTTYKDAVLTGYGAQVGALLAALPRLPAALRERQCARVFARRSDRQVLALANDVRHHANRYGPKRPAVLVVLSLGTTGIAPPALPGVRWISHTVTLTPADRPTFEARVRRVPKRFWNTIGVGAVVARLREWITETDHDVLWLRDVATLTAVTDDVLHEATVVDLTGATALSSAEQRLVRARLRRVRRVACATAADQAFAAKLVDPERCLRLDAGATEVTAQLAALVNRAHT